MRVVTPVAARAAQILGVAFALGGCSGQPIAPLTQSPATPALRSSHNFATFDPSGIAPKFLTSLRGVAAQESESLMPSTSPLVYVADAGTKAIEVLQTGTTYKNIGTITGSIKQPAGDWVDRNGNLYVADYENRDVVEYPPRGSSPTCTYSSRLTDPVNVATDANDDVYVVDYNFGSGGSVNLYRQCSNAVVTQYAVGGGAEGAALDTTGDLFVSYNVGGGAALEEFPAGSTTPTPLGAPLSFAGGLILDQNGNLLACDQVQGYVDLIPPPYNSIELQYSGFIDPLNVSLAGNGKLLFVADPGSRHVAVLRYPNGIRVKRLGHELGLSVPVGAAASPSLVP